MKNNTRTARQNRALWLLFQHLADELNSSGLEMRKVLKPEIEIPWTKQTICDFVWRPVQKAQVGKESTTELTTKEIDAVFDTINRHLGQKFGISIQFPSISSVIIDQMKEDHEN